MPSSREKIDLMVRISPFNQRVHSLIFFMDKMNGKKTYGQLFQARCPKGKGTFFKEKKTKW
jgi:hypothetical protein